MGLWVWSVFHRAMDPLEERIRSWTGKAVLIIEPFFFLSFPMSIIVRWTPHFVLPHLHGMPMVLDDQRHRPVRGGQAGAFMCWCPLHGGVLAKAMESLEEETRIRFVKAWALF